jgi:uncharacterized protein
MLVEFTVANYRSIRDRLTLSAVAQVKNREAAPPTGQRARRPDYEIAPAHKVPGRKIQLLPVVAIFGANASGKSNVVMALDNLLALLQFGLSEGRRSLAWVVPFKLDRRTATAPTEFSVTVALGDTVFVYALTLDRTRIFSERLDYLPAAPAQMRNLFDRRWDPDAERYLWSNGPDFRGAHTQLQDNVRSSQPFLSLLVTSVTVDVVLPLTTWLMRRWPGVGLGYEYHDQHIASYLGHGVQDVQQHVSDMLRRFDTGISHISIVKSEDSEDDAEQFEVMVHHSTSGEFAPWSIEEESTGTQRLYGLACRMRQSVSFGTPMIVDELGANIHPNITKHIVKFFQSLRTNPRRAQLLLTSHDNTLMRGSLLRRDEIWFTQKRPDLSTDLYPLTAFHPRNDLAIDKAYLDGRFDAVPILPDDELLVPESAG